MSAVSPCQPCCSTPQSVNIPGLQGADGNSGTNGVNAFTSLNAQIAVVPAVGATVTATVQDSSWMVIGEIVIIGQGLGPALVNPGPSTFQITAIPSSGSVTLKYLGYSGDINPAGGNALDSGCLVSPNGGQLVSPLPINQGGTGATTAQLAANALNARVRLLGKIVGANFNVTTDQPIASLPAKYLITSIIVTNASTSLTTAKGSLYDAATKGGVALLTGGATQVYTTCVNPTNWMSMPLSGGGGPTGGPATNTGAATTIYLSLTTAQGAPATADVYVFGEDLT